MVMKKKAKHKHLLRSIKKTGVSFFAVAFIAGTSIAIFLGMHSSTKALLVRADHYYNEQNLATWEVTCANGITEEDIDAISGWDHVSAAEGGYIDTVYFPVNGEKVSLQVLSFTDIMNQPVVLEGTLPEEDGEIAVEEEMADQYALSPGDYISLEHDGCLRKNAFLVTAVINQPRFSCSTSSSESTDIRGKGNGGLGSNEFYVMVPGKAFDSDYYHGAFTTAYVDTDELDGIYYYSDRYREKEEPLRAALETEGETRARLRYESLLSEGQEKTDDAEQKISDAEKKISDSEQELSDGKEELDQSLETLQGQLSALGLSTDLDEAEEQLQSMKDMQAAAEASAAAADGEVTGENAAVPGEGAVAEMLLEAIQTYRDKEAELSEAETKLADSRADLEEASDELAEAKEELADVTLQDWIVSNRNEMGDVRGVETAVSTIDSLSISLAMIFLVVAAVICYASITRMIDEQRVLLGTQKAVGFRQGEIIRHYLSYSALCAALGVVMAYAGSVFIVEVVVIGTYQRHLLVGSVPWNFAWGPALLATALCFAIFLAATYIACFRLLKVPATMLLRGEIPEKKKNYFFQNWKGYRKLSLYSRTMIRNVLGDKGRMLTTIAGLMGCVSLLIISFSFKFGIENSSIRQFDRYFLYNDRLVINTEEGSASDYTDILSQSGVDHTLIQEKLETFRVDGGEWDRVRVLVAKQPDQLENFIFLQDLSTKDRVPVPEEGVLISRKLAELNDLSAGDTLELMDSNGNARECRVAGVIEHYQPYHLFVTSESYWKSVMGEEPDFSVFLLKGSEEDVRRLKEQAEGKPGFLFLRDNSDYASDASHVSGVVYVCVALSFFMLMLVLLNQTNMYINRKSRELAVMRVNGYSLGEAKAYIYKDNCLLIAVGLILGLLVGIGLAYIVVWMLEPGPNHFVRDPSGKACLYAALIVVVVAILVNVISLRKVNHLNLTNVSGN